MNLQDLLASFHKLVFHTSTKPVLKEAQVQTSQQGTTELFFDNEANQRTFQANIKNEKRVVIKTLMDYYRRHSGKEITYKLEMNAESKKGAKWLLTATPSDILPELSKALNIEFRALMGISMVDRAKIADAAAKTGKGSGLLIVDEGVFS